MKSKYLALGFILLMAFSSVSVWAEGKQERQEEACRAINEIWHQYCISVEEYDSVLFLSLHEPDAYKMPPQMTMYQVRDMVPFIQESWDRGAELWEIKMSINCKETIVRDDFAWSMGTYNKIYVSRNGSNSSSFNGKFLTILRKQEDGSWKIYRDCYNSNLPM